MTGGRHATATGQSTTLDNIPVRVLSCGSDVDVTVCERVKAAAWIAEDHCAACSDPRHLDLYIGEEDSPDFEDLSPSYFDAHGAVVALHG